MYNNFMVGFDGIKNLLVLQVDKVNLVCNLSCFDPDLK
jgi:hypothetical protein